MKVVSLFSGAGGAVRELPTFDFRVLFQKY